MNRWETCCDDDRLRRLLDAEAPTREGRLATQHVETCARCQARLEQLAADQMVWREAQAVLAAEAAECAELGATADGEAPWRPSRWDRRVTAWTESMARQLLSPPSHPEMLGRLGRYEVERLIGAGGMGVVFKAFDTELNRPVAVKVLAPHLAGSGAARKRFAREARAAAAVVHEHVVSIHNVETDSESPFLVMQYVAGESLQGRIDRDGPLHVCEILRIGMQTAAGLAAAHAQGLVHRDVKPSNILLEKGVERALLTDFGLARASDDASLTHSGCHPGTPQYMSPEQARGEGVDARSDLFSLGSVIYVMCVGRSPFRAETSYGVLRRITDEEPRSICQINPDVPQWLEWIVARLHAKSPEHRFASANEVRAVLEQCLAHMQQPATVALPASCRPRKIGNRDMGRGAARRVRLGLASVAVLGLLAVASSRIANSPTPEEPTAGAQSPADSDFDSTVSADSVSADSVSNSSSSHSSNFAEPVSGSSVSGSSVSGSSVSGSSVSGSSVSGSSVSGSWAPQISADAAAWDAAARDIEFYREDMSAVEIRSRELWDVRHTAKPKELP